VAGAPADAVTADVTARAEVVKMKMSRETQ
jgi:hypothetical protein